MQTTLLNDEEDDSKLISSFIDYRKQSGNEISMIEYPLKQEYFPNTRRSMGKSRNKFMLRQTPNNLGGFSIGDDYLGRFKTQVT